LIYATTILQNTVLDEVIERKDWRDQVMASERLWLIDYYQDIVEMMNSHANRDCVFDYICNLTPFDR